MIADIALMHRISAFVKGTKGVRSLSVFSEDAKRSCFMGKGLSVDNQVSGNAAWTSHSENPEE